LHSSGKDFKNHKDIWEGKEEEGRKGRVNEWDMEREGPKIVIEK